VLYAAEYRHKPAYRLNNVFGDEDTRKKYISVERKTRSCVI
jgi:hypothetical protein